MNSTAHLPLSLIGQAYGAAVAGRNWLYGRGLFPSYKSALRVISVGNITAGGNGKTPLCAYIAMELRAAGFAPAILSRGYGGRASGPRLVLAADSYSEVGDEALLLAQEGICPVVIARQRKAGLQLIQCQKLADVVVLDDGFQHLAVQRDLDLVCVDVSSDEAVRAFVEAEMLPAGRFREPRDLALRRANAVILATRKVGGPAFAPPQELKAVLKGLPIFISRLTTAGLTSLEPDSNPPPSPGSEVGVFCGIANPNGFMASVSELGYKVAEQRIFWDHHCFTQRDIDRLYPPTRPWICTPKDAVKLKGLRCPGLFVLKTSTVVEPAQEFREMILKPLKSYLLRKPW